VLSFLCYNFFFIEPLYTFQVTQPHELLALIIFLIVAIVTSTLAGRREHLRVRCEAVHSGAKGDTIETTTACSAIR
jgi:two-component system sensor histidine kinase KdpD